MPLRQLDLWRLQGYRPEYPPGSVESGWPPVLVHEEDGLRFHQEDEGVYLPEGYTPGTARDPEYGRPLTLVRDDDQVEFLWIAGGTFQMGHLDGVPVPDDDPSRPAHRVTLSGFYVGSSRVDLQACKLEYSIVSPK